MLTRTIKAKLPPNVVQKFGCLSMENDEEDLIYISSTFTYKDGGLHVEDYRGFSSVDETKIVGIIPQLINQ